MSVRRVLLLVAVGLPPVLLAGLGLAHPATLTADSASRWRDLHILLLPLFPLLGLAPWLTARRHGRALGWLTAVLGYVYATCYTALDVLAGVGAGAVQGSGGGAFTRVLFAQGNDLADYGVYAYLAATLIAAVAALRRAGVAALPGVVLVVPAAWSFLDSHIYWPRGGLTMLGAGIGWMLLAAAVERDRAAHAGPARPPAPAARGVG